jgi:hypothetical protein
MALLDAIHMKLGAQQVGETSGDAWGSRTGNDGVSDEFVEKVEDEMDTGSVSHSDD